MAKIELAPEVGDDIEPILDHLAQYQVEDAPARIQVIIQAIAVLEPSSDVNGRTSPETLLADAARA